VVATALAIAPALGAAVEAVHVTENGHETAREAAARGGLALERLHGDPVATLLRLAEELDVVAVVLGTRSRRAEPRAAGHVAMAVANGTDTPVVVVNPDCRPPRRLARVVVALEGTATNSRSLARAIELAADADLALIAVHVDDEGTLPSFSDQTHYETEAYTREFLARFVPGAERVELELRVGEPAQQILDVVKATGADLVAIGRPRTHDVTRGLVAREIVRRSPVPVFLAALAPSPSGG
jgi:nucleotide-binding universal stress UspA family protein